MFVLLVSWLSVGPGERHMKVTWSSLRTLCPSVWVGAAVPQARAVLNHQHRAVMSLSYSSFEITSHLSNRSHQNKPLKTRHQSALPGFSVKGEKGVSGIFHALVETSIKAPLVLMKAEFSPASVTFKTSQMKK